MPITNLVYDPEGVAVVSHSEKVGRPITLLATRHVHLCVCVKESVNKYEQGVDQLSNGVQWSAVDVPIHSQLS